MSKPIYKNKMDLIKEAAGIYLDKEAGVGSTVGAIGGKIKNFGEKVVGGIKNEIQDAKDSFKKEDKSNEKPSGLAAWMGKIKPGQRPQRPGPLKPGRPSPGPEGFKPQPKPDRPMPMPGKPNLPGKPKMPGVPAPMPGKPNKPGIPKMPGVPAPMPGKPNKPGIPSWMGGKKKEMQPYMGKKASYLYSDLVSDARAITDHAFHDELSKLAGKGTVFSKAIKSLKSLGAKAKDVGVKIDKKVQNLGKSVGSKTGLGTKTKKVKGKNKPTMSTKRKRQVGYGTIGAGALGALGLKELVD